MLLMEMILSLIPLRKSKMDHKNQPFNQEHYWLGHKNATEAGWVGFKGHLALAYFKADMTNAKRLFYAFPEVFQKTF